MHAKSKVGLDSNAVTYLSDAMRATDDPSADGTEVGAERLALLRVYLYGPADLCVTPTVVREYARIPDIEHKRFHESLGGVLLNDGPWLIYSGQLESRTRQLLVRHKQPNDCFALAEAELAGFHGLLTFDKDFHSHLRLVAQGAKLMWPSEYWKTLRIQKGTKPRLTPASTNPLASQTWWQT